MNIILLESSELRPGHEAVVSDDRAAHMRSVLQVGIGSLVRVGLIDGPLGTAAVTLVTDTAVTLQCTFDPTPPARPRIDLLLALPRPKVLRRLWTPLAELGVGRIILTNAEKVERDYFDTHLLRPEGFRPLLLTGLQQARDTHVPQVSVHKRFKVLVEDELAQLCPTGQRLMAHPTATGNVTRAMQAMAQIAGHDRVLLAVGPEGGWNGFELALLGTHGFHAISLGPRTLSTTTACIALISQLHAAIDGAAAGRRSLLHPLRH